MKEIDGLLSALRDHYPAGPAPRLGCGERPAVLIVDLVRGWTDPASPLAADLDETVAAAAQLLTAARSHGAPTVFTTVTYRPDDLDAPLVRKAPRVACLEEGSPWTELDPRLGVLPDEHVLVKQGGSAFFGTGLAEQLDALRVDTVLLAGCVTSGCVRASAVDAAQHGFRSVVVRDACGDRSPLAHEANLLDIEQRYGDVVRLDDAERYLASLSGR